MKYRIAKIVWVDSFDPHGGSWGDLSRLQPQDYDARCISVGYVMDSPDPALLVIAPHISIEADQRIGQTNGVLCIPRSAIVADETIFETDNLI